MSETRFRRTWAQSATAAGVPTSTPAIEFELASPYDLPPDGALEATVGLVSIGVVVSAATLGDLVRTYLGNHRSFRA